MITKKVVSIGALAVRTAEAAGRVGMLSWQALVRTFRPPFDLGEVARQIHLLGVRSTKIAILTATATGAVIGMQFGYGLDRFGAREYVGPVVALAILRELGPVLTALVVGGRIGSGMAAELGSMKVGEQIDAIRALGADPIKKLIAPRLAASLIIMPLLTVLADITGILGAMAVAATQFDVPALYFYRSVVDVVVLDDLFSGLGKSVFFGFFVAMIGCYQGFETSGGTEGVGRSTTMTVEMISITVLVSDFILTRTFMVLF